MKTRCTTEENLFSRAENITSTCAYCESRVSPDTDICPQCGHTLNYGFEEYDNTPEATLTFMNEGTAGQTAGTLIFWSVFALVGYPIVIASLWFCFTSSSFVPLILAVFGVPFAAPATFYIVKCIKGRIAQRNLRKSGIRYKAKVIGLYNGVAYTRTKDSDGHTHTTRHNLQAIRAVAFMQEPRIIHLYYEERYNSLHIGQDFEIASDGQYFVKL